MINNIDRIVYSTAELLNMFCHKVPYTAQSADSIAQYSFLSSDGLAVNMHSAAGAAAEEENKGEA